MKNYSFYLLAFAIVCCYLTSCKEEKEDHKERWMLTNQKAFDAIKSNHPEYKELRSPGNEGSIYYKVLKSGEGTEPVYFTSAVGCYYKGWYIADYPEYNITSGNKFDQQLFDDGPPAYFKVNGSIISGWKTALQYMVKGDKWEIWVPYQLGYGRNDYKASSSSPPVPGYSTLVFEIEVTNVAGVY